MTFVKNKHKHGYIDHRIRSDQNNLWFCVQRGPVTTSHITFGKEVIKKTVVSSGVYSHRACIIKSPYPTA